MTEELKPCPFCGDPGRIYIIPVTNMDEKEVFQVQCTSCGAGGQPCDFEEVAITRWNSRPIEDALRESAEILKELEAEARAENALLKAEPGQSLVLRCGELEAEVKRLREALERFAKIDLTGPIGDAIAWDILNARAVLKGGKK